MDGTNGEGLFDAGAFTDPVRMVDYPEVRRGLCTGLPETTPDAARPSLNANDAGTRITIAESWLAKGIDPAAAERLAREGVNLAQSDAKFLPNSSPTPWTEKMMVTRIYRSTLGWALFQQQRYDEALRELQRAVEYGEKERIRMSDVYYRLGRSLEKLNRPDEALEAYIKETAFSNGHQVPAWNAAAIYSKHHGEIEGFQTFVRSRANDFAVAASASGPFDEMNEKVARFALRGRDGKIV